MDGSLSACEVLTCLFFALSGGSKFWARSLGSKLFVVRQHRCNISIQFVPRGNQKRPAEHSHFWFLAYGRRARLSGRTFTLQVAVSLHGIKVWGIKWERKTLSSVRGKSHRYISWIAQVSKDRPARSDCWVLTPVGAKLGKFGAGTGENSSFTAWFCFRNDDFFLQRHRPFVCWCSVTPLSDKTRLPGVRYPKTGAGFQSDNSKVLAMPPVHPCHFLHFLEVSKLADPPPYAPAHPPAEQSSSRRALFRWLEREPGAGVSVKLIQSRCKSSGKSLRIRHVWKWTLLGW